MSPGEEIAAVTVRRIDRGAAALPVHDPKSLDAALEAVTQGADR